jgi:hypothetical protein
VPKILKQIVKPGEYLAVSGDGTRSPIKIDKDDVRHFQKTGNAMIAAGLPIRIPLNHLDYADPWDKDDEKAKAKDVEFNKGFVTSFKIDKHNALWGELDIPDAEFANRLEGEIKFVSPKILPTFTDGHGKTWENCIAHVALTPTPVDHTQSPFGSKPEGVLSMSLPICLSLANIIKPKKPSEKPSQMGHDMDKPNDEPKKDKPAEGDHFSKVKKLLADYPGGGIKIPDDTTEDNFIERLCLVLEAVAHTVAQAMGDKKEDDMEEPNMDKAKEEPYKVAMGLADNKDFIALRDRLDRAEALLQIERGERAKERLKAVKHKIDSMVRMGQITKDKAGHWLQTLEAKHMSLVVGEDRAVQKILDQMEFACECVEPRVPLHMAHEALPPEWANFTNRSGDVSEMTPERIGKILDDVYGKVKN